MKLHSDVTNKCSIKAFSTLEQRFRNKHGVHYDYSEVVYKGSDSLITIICPIHGPFEQTPEGHYAGRGCKACGCKKLSISKRQSITDYVEKANLVHGTKYTYLELIPNGRKSIIKYFCPIHGEMSQDAASHLTGCGCKHCGIVDRALLRTKKDEQVISEFKQIHGNRYDYSLMKYENVKQNITILCSEHGPFPQTPDTHLKGSGCPSCAVTGFDRNKPGTLYYLSINDGEAYKIGITNRNVQQRYTNLDLESITILHQIHYADGNKAYLEERRIMTKYKQYKYIGPDLLRDGNTELFNCNILNIKD